MATLRHCHGPSPSAMKRTNNERTCLGTNKQRLHVRFGRRMQLTLITCAVFIKLAPALVAFPGCERHHSARGITQTGGQGRKHGRVHLITQEMVLAANLEPEIADKIEPR